LEIAISTVKISIEINSSLLGKGKKCQKISDISPFVSFDYTFRTRFFWEICQPSKFALLKIEMTDAKNDYSDSSDSSPAVKNSNVIFDSFVFFRRK
jgi:hypothetical protein